MRVIGVAALSISLSASSIALAERASCPPHEPGANYPWQSDEVMPGDHYAWIFLDVDRAGRPFRCAFGKHNFPDPETLFWLCKSYTDRWRTSPAAPSDPNTRTIKRRALIAGYVRLVADQKARKLWFKEHPEERPECYPERTRGDRLG